MSAFRVGVRKDGSVCWWENWTCVADMTPFREVRPATDAESELMAKVVWQIDARAERERLREMLRRAAEDTVADV